MSRLDIIDPDTTIQCATHTTGLHDRIFISDIALHEALSDVPVELPISHPAAPHHSVDVMVPQGESTPTADSLLMAHDALGTSDKSISSGVKERADRGSAVDLAQVRRELTTLMRFVIEVSSGMRSVWAMPRERLSLRTINLVETLNRRNLLVQSRGPWALRCHPVAYRPDIVEFSGLWGKAGRARALAGRSEYCSENGYWRIISLRFL